MLAQRRANGLPDTPWVSLGSAGKGASTQSGPAASHNNTKDACAAAQSSSRPVKRKPGFGLKEAVELRAVTKQMEALQANITRLEGLLAAPDFYTQDPDGFARAGTALTQAQQQLTRLEERWLALESLREEAAAEER
jgi:ATP-binding cassette subfamily F protein uup